MRELLVLFVDDDPDDVELERASLRHDFEISETVVDSPETFRAALSGNAWDVILCDYSMPRMDGMEALRSWQASGIDVPFIFVTGRLSEDVAVECMKSGATDYVLKGNLARLPAAVDRALREYAAARELRRIEAERARVIAAVEQSYDAVVITDPAGSIVYVNPAFARINGYTLDECRGQTPRILKSDVRGPEFYAGMWRRILAGKPWSGLTVNRRRDGSLYDCELTIAPIFDGNGRIANFCGLQRDVSERVAAERELRQ
ncbi:PAS domain S-box protein, partial [Candidatus Binatia bacterium]|nr:PAS domain S-box protein [Candidatus Binatia bacterium]